MKFVTNEEQYNRFRFSRYTCPTSTDYHISPDFFEEFANLQVNIKKCINTTQSGNHCKTDSEIQNKMGSLKMQVTIISAYIDYDDYDNPIKN